MKTNNAHTDRTCTHSQKRSDNKMLTKKKGWIGVQSAAEVVRRTRWMLVPMVVTSAVAASTDLSFYLLFALTPNLCPHI